MLHIQNSAYNEVQNGQQNCPKLTKMYLAVILGLILGANLNMTPVNDIIRLQMFLLEPLRPYSIDYF